MRAEMSRIGNVIHCCWIGSFLDERGTWRSSIVGKSVGEGDSSSLLIVS